MRTILILSLALTMGCKDKPKRQNPPANIGSAATAPGSAGSAATGELQLPKGDGTPPKKTTAPHTKADYERLSKLEFPGFGALVRTVGEKVFEVRHITRDRPKLWATVTISHCFECVPMELDKWKAKTEDLKLFLGDLKKSPDVDFEVGELKLNGAPVIFTHQVGTSAGSNEAGGTFGYTNALVAYYHDGINQIRVVAEYKDDPVKKEDLLKVIPKADLAKVALAFIDAYTHAW